MIGVTSSGLAAYAMGIGFETPTMRDVFTAVSLSAIITSHPGLSREEACKQAQQYAETMMRLRK